MLQSNFLLYVIIMNPISVTEVAALHQSCIILWQEQTITCTQTDFLKLVEENHAYNFQLWQAEDRARRDDLGSDFVYHAKREIDRFNQQRNNRMEAMDAWITEKLNPAPIESCPVHSETPGMIIDRLSILSLKKFYMHLQTVRENTDATHRRHCTEKSHILNTQHQQLLQCLNSLLQEIINRTRTFRVYHQFKMYNDPKLNPQLYTAV